MRRLRKKRNGRTARRRQVDQRDADLFAQVNGYRDMRDMRHKQQVEERKWRTGWRRALDKWRTKWRPVAQKYRTPRKLRGNKMMWAVRDAIGLIDDYPHYFELTFWHDLKKRGVDFPFYLPFLLAEMSRKPSELLRAIADYIDD